MWQERTQAQTASQKVNKAPKIACDSHAIYDETRKKGVSILCVVIVVPSLQKWAAGVGFTKRLQSGFIRQLTSVGMGTQLRASLNALRGLAARVVTHFKVRTVVVIALWYLLSCATLFLNKHILDDFGTSPEFLGVVQMFSTAVYGGLKMASGFHNPSPIVFDRSFVRDMSVLGVFRCDLRAPASLY